MVYIRYPVGELDDDALQSGRHAVSGVIQDAVPDLPGQIEAFSVVLKFFHYADGLLVMREVLREAFLHNDLAGMPEGSVAYVMSQRSRFAQVLVQHESP